MASVPERPPYEPGVWTRPAVQNSTNCYDYACDARPPWDNWAAGHKSTPGRAHNHTLTPPATCPKLDAAVRADGLSLSTATGACDDATFCWKVALYICPPFPGRPEGDFHFVRQDRGGGWSHKQSHNAPSTLDSAGNPITNPRTADIRFPGTQNRYQFCNYYCVCRQEVRIAMAEPRIRPDGALASVLLNSGMPDPGWTIAGRDLAVLAAKLSGLPALRARPRDALAAGRLSFSIQIRKKGLPRYVKVSNGAIDVCDARGRWLLWQDAKGLETWLTASASRSPIGKDVMAVLGEKVWLPRKRRPNRREKK